MAKNLGVLAVGIALFYAGLPAAAQEPGIAAQAEVTLVGCVERESAYRTRLGLPASGIGQNDIVLKGARAANGTPVTLSGDFGLTGRLEAQLLGDVGHRVEITGFIEDTIAHESRQATTLRRLFIKIWHPASGACS
jgi:hypothetical protein